MSAHVDPALAAELAWRQERIRAAAGTDDRRSRWAGSRRRRA
jgi:hypothetical protein